MSPPCSDDRTTLAGIFDAIDVATGSAALRPVETWIERALTVGEIWRADGWAARDRIVARLEALDYA
jgi:hypothetical protein